MSSIDNWWHVLILVDNDCFNCLINCTFGAFCWWNGICNILSNSGVGIGFGGKSRIVGGVGDDWVVVIVISLFGSNVDGVNPVLCVGSSDFCSSIIGCN